MKFGSLFTGGGGADFGAVVAGFTPVWGIENNERIAAVAKRNGLDVIVADVRNINYAELPNVDVLHASPPCVNFSPVKGRARNVPPPEETRLDFELALAVSRGIEQQRPRLVTIENVIGYRKSQSFQTILETLKKERYAAKAYSVNFFDFGVPQTRRRLFIIACREYEPPELTPEPANGGSWFDAVSDLLTSLQSAKPLLTLSGAQKIETGVGAWVVSHYYYNHHVIRAQHLPVFTLTANADKIRVIIDGICYFTTPAMWRRWQTFPDAYISPETRTLAARVFGNAVPSVGYVNILKQIIK